MLSTFVQHQQTEPRHRLRPGVTKWHSNPRHRPRSVPSEASPPPPEKAPTTTSAKEFALQTLHFPADEKQQEVLDSPSRRVLVCCTRQWGKSTTAAIKALHHALVNPASLVLVASRTRRQAGELLHKVIDFALQLDFPIRRAPRHPDSLLLPNLSRIIALPGQPEALRCFSAVSLLILDEAAYVPDELYHTLRPMLATTNGALWLLSTPRGRQGFFHQEWISKDDVWAKFSVKAPDCPRIDPAFLAEEQRLRGPAIFGREYLCDFASGGESCFDIDSLDAASEEHAFRAAQQFASGRPAARFYIGFDLGQKSSFSAVATLELVRGRTTQRNPVTFEFIEQSHLM